MNKNDVLQAIKKVRKNSKKRNFVQKFDLVINLKDLDLKKTDNQVDSYVTLHYSNGKKTKVAAFIGPELSSQKEAVDLAITQEEFPKYSEKKALKKLAKEYDYFIAQANLMPKVATAFGKVLGLKGKMPNPKAGCVVPPNANLKVIYERLQKLVRVTAKTIPVIHCIVGNEETKDEEITDNAMTIYKHLINRLPSERHNIKNVCLKLTMGKPVKIGEKEEPKKEIEKEKKPDLEKKEEEKKEIKEIKEKIPEKKEIEKEPEKEKVEIKK